MRLPLAFTVALAVLVPLTTGGAADAGSCASTPGLLSRTPVADRVMPGGGRLTVWDTGPTPNPDNSIRLVAVRYPVDAPVVQRGLTTPTLTQSAVPSAYARNTARAVVVINGGFFNPTRGTLPVGPQLKDGHLQKATSNPAPVIATLNDGHSAYSTLSLAGSAVSGSRSWRVVGLNHQALSSNGVTVYTPAWGPQRRPLGSVDVIVKNGRVIGKRTGSYRGKPVSYGTLVITAAGSTGSQLASLPVGAPMTASWHAVLGRPDMRSAIGAGGRRIYNGTVWPECTTRSEELRPRSAIAWTKTGDVIVMTVSGRSTKNGVRWGGATAHQVGEYLKKLGAYEAISLDGGTSTAMFVRYSLGTSPIRVDRSPSDSQRAVPNVLEIEPLAAPD